MRLSGRRRTALLLGALAATTVAATSGASAQNIFERIFGARHMDGVQDGRFPQAPRSEQRAPAPVSIPKVSAPTYYTFNPDSPKRIDFGPAIAASENRRIPDASVGSVFRDAMAELGDYDLYAEADIAKAVANHYAADPQFIWVSDYAPNERARKVLRMLGEAGSYGLSESDYNVALANTDFSRDDAAGRLRELARFEMALSARVLRYARDAATGRLDPNKLSGYHDFPKKPFDAAKVLDDLQHGDDATALLAGLHPQNEKYKDLRAELEALRASPEEDIVVDPETFVRPGGSDANFAKLLKVVRRDADDDFLASYGDLLDRYAGSETYEQDLVPVIKAAQKAHDLNDDGVVGPRTVGALAGDSRQARIEKVLLALERLRWLPSDLGDPRVVINASAFEATYTEGGRDKLTMRVVVGKTTNQTSFFYDEIEYVEYNPYWGVPKSIIVNEMLPKLLQDPGYLDRAGYEVTDSKGRHIPSSSIDWRRYGANIPFDVRQLPSEANALGELKIMFPNKHAIYMHDTPQKSFFNRDTRAFSHGCVRLQNPRDMAAAVLGSSVQHVSSRVAEGHSQEKVKRKIPVYVGYFTAWPNDAGKVAYSGDIYDRDEHLRSALDKVHDMRAPAS